MPTSSWLELLIWLVGTPRPLVELLAAINWYALGIAVIAPILMLLVRHEVRLSRLRAIVDFMTTFDFPGLHHTTASTAPRGGLTPLSQSTDEEPPKNSDRRPENPSFEYVKSKYISDLKIPPEGNDYKRLSKATTDGERINIYIDIAGRLFRNINAQLYLTAAGFMLVSYFGFSNFLSAFGFGIHVTCNLTEGCGVSLSQTVGSFAFIGAYVAAVRMLVRRLSVFDLSAYSFLWQSIEIIATVLIVVLIYNAMPDPAKGVVEVGRVAVEAAATVSGSQGQQKAAGETSPPAQHMDAAGQPTGTPQNCRPAPVTACADGSQPNTGSR